jgi:single-strand DNA-binding protein
MASFNKVILMGNLTRDPRVGSNPGGSAVCDFSIAINRRYSINGQEKEEVCFVDIVTWGKQADSCGKYLQKGSAVFVEGRLKTESWNDKEGNKRSRLVVTAERIQFLNFNRTDGRKVQSSPENYDNQDDYSSQETPRQNTRSNVQSLNQKPPMPVPPSQDIFADNAEHEDDIPF